MESVLLSTFEPNMKRLIRTKGTGVYLSADRKWVPDYRSAQDFETTEAAIAAVAKVGCKDAELVLVMGPVPSERFDIVLPLFPNHRDHNRVETNLTDPSNKS